MPPYNTYQPDVLCVPIPAASSRTSQSMSPTRETQMMPNFAAEGGIIAKRLLPFGTAGRTAKMARTVYNNAGSPKRNTNMVLGQEGSPVGVYPLRVIRTPALPRTVGALNAIIPENLRQELQSVLHEAHERYTEQLVQTTKELTDRIKTLEDKIGEGFNRLDSALKKVDDHHRMLEGCADGSGRDLTKLTAQIHAEVSEVKAGLYV